MSESMAHLSDQSFNIAQTFQASYLIQTQTIKANCQS
jgi:hypothetical protein